QIERIVADLHQGGLGVLYRHELAVRGLEQLLEESAGFRIVVDDEDSRHRQDALLSAWAAGRSMTNRAPSTWFEAEIEPPCARITSRTMARPRPLPCPIGFVVTHGSKRRSTTSA